MGTTLGWSRRGGQLGLAQEPFPEALVGGQLRGQQLQGHPALQAQLLGEVDDAHAAAAQQRVDAVAGKLGSAVEVGGELGHLSEGTTM